MSGRRSPRGSGPRAPKGPFPSSPNFAPRPSGWVTSPHVSTTLLLPAPAGQFLLPQTQDVLWAGDQWRGPSTGNAPPDCSTSFPASRARASYTPRAPAGPVGQIRRTPFVPFFPPGVGRGRDDSCSARWARVLHLPNPGLSAGRAEVLAPRRPRVSWTREGFAARGPAFRGRGVRYPPADFRSSTRASRFPSVGGRPLPPLARGAFELRGSLAPGAREGFTEGRLVS